MTTLDELLEKRSPESRRRIAKKVDEMKREIGLYQIREARDVSQTELAIALGVKQPTIAKIEQPGNNHSFAAAMHLEIHRGYTAD
ncbi:helix-turn-helix domain-containing protein [Photorhabdus heterorhabditis]|uniref:Transcriptional regulator n=1 Tax=Photorhabdus heterorhabditis TaxID=880156 RepID=A0A5B0WQP8_9GAMM|nr:helix-turn-helix transcriptional regulator [Photorhabdus heterorhabditis]KAA1188309.1 helix-turn-helix transcriptional regulator [Photorhabdus heterorhabditis]KOY62423.1 transcriptional regulator [Photorhabdus heterorhabditis]MBS9444214.1 XRE family transcriptional regulator [Photorhabdus heterorhabditis]